MDTRSKKVVIKEQASFTELLDHREAIILDLENLHYYSLNAAASFLWKQLRARAVHTAESLSAALAAAFGINAGQAASETHAWLNELEQYGLISYAALGVEEKLANPGTPTTEPLPPYAPPLLKLSNSLRHMTLSGSSTVSSGAITALGGGS